MRQRERVLFIGTPSPTLALKCIVINGCQHAVSHTVTSFIQQSELSSISFSANLLTICIPSCVSPHLIYHICNLYRGLPLPSPSRVSASADGFCRPTLSPGPSGLCMSHGFTGHLNSAAGPSIQYDSAKWEPHKWEPC